MKDKITGLIFTSSFLLLSCIIGCKAPDQPVYGPGNPDPNPTGKQAASITTILPDTAYLKDVITISGSGFSSIPEYNFVAFGTKIADIISSSENEIQVQAPLLSDVSVMVKVAIKGSEFWSNELPMTFNPAVKVIDDEIAWPMGVAVDSEGNVYVASAEDEVIYKITSDGTKSEFVATPVNGAMEFGANEYLYACEQGEGKIVRISPDGGTIEDVVEVDSPIDFDWDADGNMYIVSNWSGIIKMDGSGGLTQVAEIDNPKCVRIFGNNLYVSDIWNSQILKYDITAGGLENEETIYEGDSPLGLEISENGTIFFTEAWETSLYTLNPDGSAGEVWYEDELETPMHYLTFYGKQIYIVYPGWGGDGVVLQVYAASNQAPNYGRQ